MKKYFAKVNSRLHNWCFYILVSLHFLDILCIVYLYSYLFKGKVCSSLKGRQTALPQTCLPVKGFP